MLSHDNLQNAASQLERQINRWATDILRTPPASLNDIRDAAFTDLVGGAEFEPGDDARPMLVQNLLRHLLAETISEAIINCLIVTSSTEANIQLTRIHEHIFARASSALPSPWTTYKIYPAGDPTVASVWRRQTFSAAVDACSPEMSRAILEEHMPTLIELLSPADSAPTPVFTAAAAVLESAYEFSRMLHGSPSSAGDTADAFYRSFVPELGSTLYPRQVELVKRCMRSERGELDRVGATIFPGLVKVTRGPMTPGGRSADNMQTVVRRAQVICECALQAGSQAHTNGSAA